MAENLSNWFPLAQQPGPEALLYRLDGEFLFVLMLIGTIFSFVTLMVISTTAMKLFQSYRQAKLSSDLIHDMLARQMSVEQIVMVLDSWNGRRTGQSLVEQWRDTHATSTAPAKPPKPVKMPV